MRDDRPVLLRCQVGVDSFALEASRVKRIVRPEEELDVPVVPLAELLGLDAGETGPRLVLDRVALAVTKVARPTPVEWADLAALPAAARDAQGLLAGVARMGGEMALVLDTGRLSSGGAGLGWAMPAARRWPGAAAQGAGKALFFMGPGGARKTMFAVSYGQVVEAARELRYVPLRGANPCIAGLADWRDQVVPVVDLEALLGVPGGAVEGAERYLIVRSPGSGELFALPAGHCAAASLPLGENAPVRRVLEPMTPWVRAAYALDGGVFVVPDLDRLAAG